MLLWRKSRKVFIRPNGVASQNISVCRGKTIYRITEWLSHKQSRLSFLSIGAEILAACHSTHRSLFMAERIQQFVEWKTSIPLVLTIDSIGICSTITTLHEGKDYRLQPTAAQTGDSFETDGIASVQWTPRGASLPDALTEKNTQLFCKLILVASPEALPESVFSCGKNIHHSRTE